MTVEEAAIEVIRALEDLGIAYMLTGSLAGNMYSIPRSTKDVDLVIDLSDCTIQAVMQRLGSGFVLEAQMTFEGVTGMHRYRLRCDGASLLVELFVLSDAPHDQERFRRRKRGKLHHREVLVPTPEDVIITKLYWSRLVTRAKDIEDARNIIVVQGERLDWPYIRRWCATHGTTDQLEFAIGEAARFTT